jgi:formate--tetrahydrofolate ligase
VNNAFVEGGDGAIELAQLVVNKVAQSPSEHLKFAYAQDDTIEEKLNKVAVNLYGAKQVVLGPTAKNKIKHIVELGYDKFPICIAKTQYSFSTDAKAINVPTGFNLQVKDIVINAGAEMLVAVCGDILRMPGLPKLPQANHIDIIDGNIEGLS